MIKHTLQPGGWWKETQLEQPRCPHCKSYLTYRHFKHLYECTNSRCPVIYTLEANSTYQPFQIPTKLTTDT